MIRRSNRRSSTRSNLSRTKRTELTQAALKAVSASGAVLVRYFFGRAANSVQFKGRNDLVTAADLHSCRVIRDSLKSVYPNHDLLFEEGEFSELSGSRFRWIVDPLDGTTFHNRGLPFFSTILALEVQGFTELGICCSPVSGDLFIAGRSQGSEHWNRRLHIERRIRVSSVRKLEEAVIGFSYGKSAAHAQQAATALSRLLPVCRSITRLGGAEIGYVASGACEAFIDNSSTPWDFAAIALLVREAGGKVTDFAGREWNCDSKSIVASNGLVHAAVLRLIDFRSTE